jgi:hypothetical protein
VSVASAQGTRYRPDGRGCTCRSERDGCRAHGSSDRYEEEWTGVGEVAVGVSVASEDWFDFSEHTLGRCLGISTYGHTWIVIEEHCIESFTFGILVIRRTYHTEHDSPLCFLLYHQQNRRCLFTQSPHPPEHSIHSRINRRGYQNPSQALVV